MSDVERLTAMVDEATNAEGDRYDQLVAVQEALREALAETDGEPAATGR